MAEVALRESEIAAFWEKVQRFESDNCWPWTASCDNRGYGKFSVVRPEPPFPTMRAHRVAYTLSLGPIPDGAKLDHLCHNADPACPGGWSCFHRRCCNPAHLEPVTSRVNLLRGKGITAMNAVKTACIQGHQFTPENTYTIQRHGTARRLCRTCQRRRQAEYAERKGALCA